MELDPLAEIEALGDARIEVDERGRDKVIAALQEIDAVEMAVAINVRGLTANPAL
jgi:hypothetical protein